MLLLSSGAFVVAAAIIRVVLTLSSSPSATTINSWGVRETIVGIITVNIPAIWPVFRVSFWKGGSAASAGTFNTPATGGKKSAISGAYEMTPSISDGATGFRTRGRGSDDGSQESIIGKQDLPSSVMVHTSYDIRTDQDNGEVDSWGHGAKGQTKTSVFAGDRA